MAKCPPCKPQITASELTTLIEFQRPVNQPNLTGGSTIIWYPLHSAWCSFAYKSGDERNARGQLNSVNKVTMTFRYSDASDVTTHMRILMDDGSLWNIRSREDVENRHTVLVFTVESNVTQ